jgi:hypothetical protein
LAKLSAQGARQFGVAQLQGNERLFDRLQFLLEQPIPKCFRDMVRISAHQPLPVICGRVGLQPLHIAEKAIRFIEVGRYEFGIGQQLLRARSKLSDAAVNPGLLALPLRGLPDPG